MAFSELEMARIRKALDSFMQRRRPPPRIRSQLDLGYRITGQSVEIFEIRPKWLGAPGETMEHAVAKTTFVRTRGVWRVFWMRRDLKWHGYEPAAELGSIEAVCRLVDEDAYACFFG